MGVNITTIAYLRVLIIEIVSTIFLRVVQAQGFVYYSSHIPWAIYNDLSRGHPKI